LGTSTVLESMETSFQQDLNGDGTIGIHDTTAPLALAESPLSVAVVATGTITSSLLRFDDNVSTHAQETYTVITAPSHGALLMSGSVTSSFTQADIDNGLITYHQDGSAASSDSFGFIVTDAAGNQTTAQHFSFQITGAPVVIESFGSTHLTQVGSNYELYDSNGSGPALKFSGANVVAGQWGANVVPIGAEATAGGYEVAWHTTGTDQYSVWATDSNGNYVSNIIGSALGTSTVLESMETSFQQDLNGDGHIGVATASIGLSVKPTVLDGHLGGQTLFAGGTPTILIGGANDVLNAGPNIDTFVFNPSFGSNTISGFAPGADTIQFDHSTFATFADVQSHMLQAGSDVVIAHDPQNQITLLGVSLANLHSSDFHIV
jgi:hypothetical protein